MCLFASLSSKHVAQVCLFSLVASFSNHKSQTSQNILIASFVCKHYFSWSLFCAYLASSIVSESDNRTKRKSAKRWLHSQKVAVAFLLQTKLLPEETWRKRRGCLQGAQIIDAVRYTGHILSIEGCLSPLSRWHTLCLLHSRFSLSSTNTLRKHYANLLVLFFVFSSIFSAVLQQAIDSESSAACNLLIQVWFAPILSWLLC